MSKILKQFLVVVFLICTVPTFGQSAADSITVYRGNFKHGSFQTDIEFDIIDFQQDNPRVTFNSLSQNAFGIPAGNVRVHGDTINFSLQSDFYRYDFTSFPYGDKTMKTVLSVDGRQFDFTLHKSSSAAHTTVKSKDVRFQSQDSYLYGTIYYPENHNGRAIYLVTSSGDQDRSASRAEAILFSKSGFISFHIDKRGTGISDGNWQAADIPELCQDDLNALEFLHQSEQMDYSLIGIKGSSQGATKVPFILKKQPQLAFGIVVSCPASTLLESDLNYWKNNNIEQIGTDDIEVATNMQKSVYQYISGDLTKLSLQDSIEKYKPASWFGQIWIPDLNEVQIDKKLNYSPLPYFKDNPSPMLVIEGSQDRIIPQGSLDKIKKTIGEKGNKKNRFLQLKGADHSMMYQKNPDFPYWSALHPDFMTSMLEWLGEF